MSVVAYIGLGSNLGDPRQQLIAATEKISLLPETSLTKLSSWYRSHPLGPPGQPDYLNAVAEIRTALSPEDLLMALQSIESSQGRTREEHWGPRTLDLDILLYGDLVLASQDLTIPHPELTRRNFVIYPLAELNPSLQLPDGQPIAKLLANMSAEGIVQLRDGE